MRYDVVILGSGSVGSFAGYYASKQGLKTCLIDNFLPPHTNGSYHGDTRIFRIAYGEGEKYISLLQHAFRLWGEFEKESQRKIFERCGVLNIGNLTSGFMQNVEKSSKDFSLNTISLSSKDISLRYGINVPSNFVGILETDTGFIYSDKSVESAIRLACSFGADLLISKISRVEKKGDIYCIYTDSSQILAEKILLSAGSFASEILSVCDFGLPHIPVYPKRKMLNWFSSKAYKISVMPAFILEFGCDHFYGFPDFGSGVKIGLNAFGQDISNRSELGGFGDLESDMLEISHHIRAFMPHLGELNKGDVCTYAMTPDEGFIIDFIDSYLLYIGGLSHGFKFAPALGELGISALQSGKLPEHVCRHFSLERFNCDNRI